MNKLGRRLDWVLVLSVTLLGLIFRLPNLYLIPRYIDEALEIGWGLDIAQGHFLPLTGFDPYYGPLYYYLIAALFRGIGVSLWLPRLVSAIFGALTVAAAFWLGRAIGNRLSGLLAAGLVAVNPALIVWSSHYAWSNSLTPFFATVAFAAFYLGVAKRNDRWLAASGLLAALMLQTHPLTVVAILGMVVWFLGQPSQWARLKQPAPYVAVALFVVGYAPMIAATMLGRSRFVNAVSMRQYAFAPTSALEVYLQRSGAFLWRLTQSFGDRLSYSPAVIWGVVLVLCGLLVVALAWNWRHGNALPGIIFATSILVFPAFVRSYGEFLVRYFTFLFPLGYAALAAMVAGVLPQVAGRVSPRMRTAAVVVCLVVIGIFSVQALAAHYTNLASRGQTNAVFFELRDLMHDEGACANNLYVQQIDARAWERSYSDYEAWLAITSTLTLDQCQYHADINPQLEEHLSKSGDTGWLIIPAQDKRVFEHQFRLEAISLDGSKNSLLAPYAVFHVTPKGGD